MSIVTADVVAVDRAVIAAESVRRRIRCSNFASPVVGVILGSGLGSAADHLLNSGGEAIEYTEIPGMPCTHVAGHAGRIVPGLVHGKPVAMLQGRVHSYEGHPMEDVLFGTRLLCQLGIRTLLITNAAGGIRESFLPGALMLISSHLRPLGSLYPDFSTVSHRWPGECSSHGQNSHLWNARLRALALATHTDLQVHEGVYAMMPGPCYETPAEVRMLRHLGADAVGMSTIPEAIFAASQGVDVLGVSCITNVAAGLSQNLLNHAEVTAMASSIEANFVAWLWNVLRAVTAEE